ncbi:MAG: hypothetical protein KF819_16505 [Labilithrix sp.]|nr:hypothetical protein [Labilithrix sp.]
MSDLPCSFCGKPKSEVARMIAGPSASICNECVALCVDVLDNGDLARVTTEGQLLVRFPDGSIHLCEQEHAWINFAHDGVDLQWCAAIAFARTPKPIAVAAVRSATGSRRVIASTFPMQTTITEAEARTVVDSFGGAHRVQRFEAPSVTKRAAKAAPEAPPPQALGGFLSPQEITNFLSMRYRVPTINLDEYVVAPEFLALVSRGLCLKHTVLPVSRAGASLIAAFADPTDAAAIEELKTETGLNVEPVIASESAIRTAIARYYPEQGD